MLSIAEQMNVINAEQADNPIVFASDGFVKVTGYSRSEIIPRNCRFLQSRETDKQAVKRLKISLDKREESVELLLNRKKNGEPFWNLLYTTPLFDEHGKLLFFLGGQINCSTTIHSASDVLRILAQSNEPEEESKPSDRTPSPHAMKPSRSRTLLRSFPFRMSSRNSIQPRAPGMEDGLLIQISEKPLKDQMNSFYTAYSNVSDPPIPFHLTHAQSATNTPFPSNSTSSSTTPPSSSPSSRTASSTSSSPSKRATPSRPKPSSAATSSSSSPTTAPAPSAPTSSPRSRRI